MASVNSPLARGRARMRAMLEYRAHMGVALEAAAAAAVADDDEDDDDAAGFAGAAEAG